MDGMRPLYLLLVGLMAMAVGLGRLSEVPAGRRPWGLVPPALCMLLGFLMLLAGFKLLR